MLKWVSNFDPRTVNIVDATIPDELVDTTNLTKMILGELNKKSPKNGSDPKKKKIKLLNLHTILPSPKVKSRTDKKLDQDAIIPPEIIEKVKGTFSPLATSAVSHANDISASALSGG